ncbi:MAG: hypothetical protein EBZ77_08205 [Chitinophagia bacterium]|nr:hypothetical protein [Chitinophagia bacterium]
MDKVSIHGIRIAYMIVFALIIFGGIAIIEGKSLEPANIVITALVSIVTGLIGYFWGASHGNNNNQPPTGGVVAVAMLAVLLLASGCRTVKHVHEQRTALSATKDSVLDVIDQLQHVYDSLYSHDTALGVPGDKLELNIDPAQLDTESVTATVGRVTGTVTKLRNGRLEVTCKADSLTVVIRNLQERLQRYYQRDSLVQVAMHKQETDTSHYVGKEKTVTFAWWWVPVGLLVGVIVFVLFINQRQREAI